jgi:hypothetical protein
MSSTKIHVLDAILNETYTSTLDKLFPITISFRICMISVLCIGNLVFKY